MAQIPSIRSVMTRSPRSVDIDASVRAAQDLMVDFEIRHLPVTEGDRLVGILSDRDIAFASNSSGEALGDRLRVREVCSLEVYCVGPDEPLDAVLAEMAERRIGSVVVIEGEKIAGLFTATDACRCFAELLRGRRASARRPRKR
jgi:acetoin utilization protein AcuB